MASRPISDEEAVAAADKEMEERANRAKELLSQRYVGLKRQQVRACFGQSSTDIVTATKSIRWKMRHPDLFDFFLFF